MEHSPAVKQAKAAASKHGRPLDVTALTRDLIRCPSVTPAEAGALDLLQSALEDLGFTCHRLRFTEPESEAVENLYARLGNTAPNFCYAGHSDVVPIGEEAAWSVAPFGAEVKDGVLYGRGAVDMKGSIGAYISALAAFLDRRGDDFSGSLSLLITGDEEGPSINGTRKVLQWLEGRGEGLDACLVGEPTSNQRLGDMIKIGRRGSLNATLTVHGTQGHSAYPQLADNAAHRLVSMLAALTDQPIDQGTQHFQPSSLQITTIDIANPTTNVIPAKATAAFNLRFNDLHSAAALEAWLRKRLDREGGDYDLNIQVSGEAFLTPPGRLSDCLSEAVRRVTGLTPELGTSGGTSDARFIKDSCPVAELGLLNATAHKVDEHTTISDLETLSAVYQAVLEEFFST